jgi:hypothetical protein
VRWAKPARAARPARGARIANAPWWHGALLALAMLATVPLVNAHIRSDGNEYYAYVRSLIIDHDLHFDDEYAHGEDSFRPLMTGELSVLPNGYRRNLASVGPSLLWTPFFLVGHIVAQLLSSHGRPVATDGYSWPYVWSCAAGSVLYALVGLWLAYRMALRFAAPGAALLATVAIWLASSLPVYVYFLPFHAHAIASFTTSWFLWNWIALRDGGGRWRWLVWGLSAGLVTAVHYLNGLLLLLAILEILPRLMRIRILIETLIRGAIFAGGFLLLQIPGLVIRWIIEGSPFITGYGAGVFFWRDPRLMAVAFSSEHGMFLWTPVLVFAVLGLIWLSVRSPAVGLMLSIQTAVFYYVVASYGGWHGHSSYGNRFMTALTPVFVLGLAALLDGLVARRGGRARWSTACAIVAVLILWNVGFMFQWGANLVPNRGPVDMRVVARNQVTVVPLGAVRFLARYLSPSSRAGLVHEIEQKDLAGRPQYIPRR